ncbi:hypothetical protein [Endozoicomonas euniceicola]|uniref:IgGFc-binding protein N-terminal domain-containing protein n=1 Tax=Endozoicomonas euniceicola TaxID=1234143 RepID=A0ABY6H384_9GAMM|nr:hypothetical protein [Endozoicomonas euniceicola]UYM18701.1 hypothetical protein NX720_12605 [Endozoicomonas euniceicola]
MFVIQAFFSGSQPAFSLILYIGAILFLTPSVRAAPIENTTALSLITKNHLNKTPELSYKISSTSKGITATPVLKGMSPVSISRSSGINHSIQINGEEHFVAASPTTDGKGLIVQTQASNGTSAHLLKVYPVQPSGQNHSFYVKDESSGATFLANADASGISLQRTGNKTTEGECQSHDPIYRVIDAAAGALIGAIVSFGSYSCLTCCK